MKKILSIMLAFNLLFFTIPSSDAAAKVGSKCKKIGKHQGKGSKKLVCKKVKGKKVWVYASKKGRSAAKDSASNINAARIGDFEFVIEGVEYNLDKEVCAMNATSNGCVMNGESGWVIDPNGANTWIALRIAATNKSSKSIDQYTLFDRSYNILAPDGGTYKRLFFTLNSSGAQIESGSKGLARMFFQIPKSLLTQKAKLLLKEELSGGKSKEYLLDIKW